MQLKYNLNDKPPVIHTLLYGLQWLVIAIPNVVTIGMLAKLQFGNDIQMQTSYLQSVYFVLGLTMLVQAFWGHRLPLVVGPAAVLIVGILSASASSSFNAIYTAVAIGGATLLLLSVSGLLGKVARIFTPRVIVVILGLIAMTLAPVIISLLFGEGHDLFSFAFFLVGLIATFALERFLRGVGKSLTVMIVTVAGSFAYFLFNGMPEVQSAGYTTDIDKLIIKPEVDIPVVISFLVCFFALLINELGSIESVRSLIGAADNGKMRRGCAVTGAGNILAGIMGVIGPVDYSISPGIISSTRCASLATIVPCAIGLLACACMPDAVVWLTQLPNVVIGLILSYVVILQLAAAFSMMSEKKIVKSFDHALTIALPLIVSLLVAFIPPTVGEDLPIALRPILTNGFVIGVLLVVFLEHIVFLRKN